MFDIGHNSAGDMVEKVREACQEAVDLEREILNAEENLKALKGRKNQLTMTEIPEAIAEAGMGSEFSLDDGTKIKITQFYSGTLPKAEEARKKAFDVIIDAGGGKLIKNELSLNFEKGEDELAQTAVNTLRGLGHQPELKETIHHQTLLGFVREKVKKGELIPLEPLGIYTGNVAKITLPKEG